MYNYSLHEKMKSNIRYLVTVPVTSSQSLEDKFNGPPADNSEDVDANEDYCSSTKRIGRAERAVEALWVCEYGREGYCYVTKNAGDSWLCTKCTNINNKTRLLNTEHSVSKNTGFLNFAEDLPTWAPHNQNTGLLESAVEPYAETVTSMKLLN